MNKHIAKHLTLSLLAAVFGFAAPVHAATTDLSTQPMAITGSTSIKPNLLFLLDDSGSMAWDRLSPDTMAQTNSNTDFCYMNSTYNGVYYNPGTTYTLPVDSTGANYPNSTFTNAKDDGFDITSPVYHNLSTGFATGGSNNNSISGPGAFYYTYHPSTVATITVSGGSSTTVSSITVNGVQLMSASASGSSTNSTEANNIAGRITMNGFSATSSGSKVTITGPMSAATYSPVITKSGSDTFAVTIFASDGTPTTPATGTCYPNANYTRVNVTSASAEAQNFANWYSYYRTRILTMKSAVGLAFKPIDSSFRVGFTTINTIDNASPLVVNIGDFDAAQRATWYTDFYAIVPNSSTPLRVALANAGRVFAHMLPGAADPMQYSCQQNFTIMTTDGMWNENTTPTQLDGTTAIGNPDAAAPRPMYDGSSYTKTTAQNQQDTSIQYQNTSQLQASPQLQSSTSNLQQRTGALTKSTVTSYTSTAYRLKISTTSGGSTSTASSSTTYTCLASGISSGNSVYCSLGTNATTTTVASCSITYNNPGSSTTDSNSRVITACTPVGVTTVTVASGGTCTPGANVSCYYNFGSWSNTSSCLTNLSSGAGTWNITSGTDCRYWDNTAAATWSAWANVSSCTAVAQSSASPYTVGTATDCRNFASVGSCPAGLTCQTVTGSSPVASCSPATASSGNDWTTTSCPPATTTPWVGVSSCTAVAASSSNGYVATNCNPANPVTTTTTVGSCTAELATAANNWTTTTCSGLTGGTPNTLADVAYYYWTTDLRTAGLGNCTGALGTDVCYNNVRGSGNDVNSQQHMTTFTLGLGVVGTLNPDGYPTLSADYNNLITGPLNWPAPVSNTNTTIDDLWHAAVNGRGVYFSAKNPNSLVTGLSQSLEGVKARQGASAAASTSNMQPVPGDSFAYVALFNTVTWDGDLLAKEIDPVTSKFVKDPVTGLDLVVWSAQAQLDPLVSATSDTRTIYTYDSITSPATTKLKLFTWATLDPATEQVYFNGMCTSPYLLSQCPTLIANDAANGTTTATAASGANLVNFLRGQHGYEDIVTNTSRIYRSRNHVLGDIVSAQPQYVRKPPFDYTDAGYADFKTAQVNRTAMVYSGANDGMLHAFDGATGTEQWAYIPPMVMPNLYRLASADYSNNHRYFVDGTPTVADICPGAPASTCTGTQWKTILVAGLNGGGRGYYALDITDPANPKALWNFTVADQANLGYTYGNPVVAKRKDNCTTLGGVTTCTGGTWVVAVTSGYNNVSPGDGKGHLFILNAYTGVQLEDIVTSAGDTTTPSGLAKINAWINVPGDNTAERYYGGDLLGNVWRFDIDNQVPPAGKEALLLAQLGGVDLTTVQPITIKPELVELVDGGGNSHAVVQVATGRYLGLSDLPNTDQQSVYALKDSLTATGLGLVRTPGVLVKQTLTTYTSGGNSYRQSTNNPVDWASKSGWYVDLNPGGDSPGERVNIDMNMQQTTLSVTGNVPDTNACNIGGYSWLYYFNFQTGYLAPLAGIKDTANSLIAGTTQIQDLTGKTHTIITHTDGSVTIQDDVAPPAPLGVSRRVSWRELTN